MSDAQHTPGWTYEVHELSEGFSAIVYDEHGRMVADHLTEDRARLIAAAPDLLEALEGLYHAYCSETGFAAAVRAETGMAYPWEPGDVAEKVARAAISRARNGGNNA